MHRHIEPESFGFLVNDVARLVRADVDRLIAAAGVGLTPGEARALTYAARAGTVRQSVLAERMGIEAMTLCSFIDKLEAQGLVSRTVDPTDRRAKLVHLTEAADTILARLREVVSTAIATASAGMSDEEWATLQTLLKRVRVTLSGNRETDKANAA